MLDLRGHFVVLAGRGTVAARRLEQLDEAGAGSVRVFTSEKDGPLVKAGQGRLTWRLPEKDDMHGAALLMMAGLSEEEAAPLAAVARGLGIFVNAEDKPLLSDFHMPAMVRRGDLLMTVSTNGAAPGLASRLCRQLARTFGPEWAERLDTLSAERARLRSQGLTPGDVRRRLDDFIGTNGWLS
jgi:precorrin-2 dehydrogenase/sirohydrochlorin ferrochelatase